MTAVLAADADVRVRADSLVPFRGKLRKLAYTLDVEHLAGIFRGIPHWLYRGGSSRSAPTGGNDEDSSR